MINFNKPEPPIKDRRCDFCGRKYSLFRKSHKGKLVHWPSADFIGEYIILRGGSKVQPFSLWVYTCQWCRATETKRKRRNR